MPNADNEPQIPKNQSSITDDRTGLVSRDWYRFFLNLLNKANTAGGSGTVTSVDVSGGTTGLTTSGGPVTTSGTITLAGTLDVDNGGTGATTAAGARTNLDVPSTTGSGASGTWGINITGNAANVTGTVAIANGGTGATTGNAALANLQGFTSTVTAAGTTTLTNTSTHFQLFTGSTTQTVVLPVTSTLQTGWAFTICNNSSGTVTVNSSGGNLVISVIPGTTVACTCIGTTLTTAADWEAGYTEFTTATGTGNVVLSSSASVSTLTATGLLNFTGTTTTNSNFHTTQTSGVMTIGGTSGTGNITFGRSTVSQQTDIQAGATASGSTKTINLGTAGLSGSTTAINIGSAVAGATSTTTLNGTVTLANALAVSSGGTGATTAAAARTNLGATTVGGNFFTLANPSAITFTRINADNTVSTLDAATFRTAIGAGTGSGTVTSVTGTSPVASSGGTTPAISLSSGYGDTQNPYASKTANFVLAAPNGSAGVPTFRAVVAADIPTLNQNTTGSAATLTTGRTISITGDLAYTSPSFDGSANVTAAGTLATVNANVGSFTNASITVNGKGLITAASSGTAPVTSVTGTSPVVSSGGATPAISLASGYGDTQNPYASKTANFFLAAPNGSAGVPTFRAVVAADIPTLNQNTTGSAATLTTARTIQTNLASTSSASFNGSANITPGVTGTLPIANGGTGETTRQAAMDALAGAVTSGQYLRGNGTDVVMSAIQAADVPTLNQNTTGTASNVTGVVAIANGGTGQTTASAAFNALSPVTSTGDLILGNGVNSSTRLPIGANNYVLTSNGTTAVWAVASGSGATITNDTTTATNVYPTFAAATSGSLSTIYTSNAKLLYKPSTGELTSTAVAASNGIFVNSLTIGTSYTIPAGYSGMSAGTVTVSGGVTVTVPSGSRWVVV